MSEPKKEQMDLYEVLTKPVLEMDDEELIEAMTLIREQRKVRIAATKAKSGLDLLLGKLTTANARAILQQLSGSPNPEAGTETETEAEKKVKVSEAAEKLEAVQRIVERFESWEDAVKKLTKAAKANVDVFTKDVFFVEMPSPAVYTVIVETAFGVLEKFEVGDLETPTCGHTKCEVYTTEAAISLILLTAGDLKKTKHFLAMYLNIAALRNDGVEVVFDMIQKVRFLWKEYDDYRRQSNNG